MNDIEQLQRRFQVQGVRFERGNGDLPCIRIATDQAVAEIYLLGAHITRFRPAGSDEVIFVSRQTSWEAGKAIRGGVPICFPWFGPRAEDPAAPIHGFARLRTFEVESVEAKADGVEIVLSLAADDQTRAIWDADFVLRHRIHISRQLTMTLEVENRGSAPIAFEEALHTYFRVDDVRQVRVVGLAQARYIDKVDGGRIKVQDEPPITITAETDRLYLNTTAPTTIEAAAAGRAYRVEKAGSDSTVVWNPWIAKSKALPDFGDDEWPGMICVETVNANENAVTLQAGQVHRMMARIAVV